VNSAQAPKADLVSGTASGAARKGIIAAGIQEHDLVPGRSDRLKDCLKLDRASGRAALAAISHVCRREDVSAGEVHAVASIEDDGVIGTLRFGLEVIQRCMKLRVGEILFFDYLEAVLPEKCRDLSSARYLSLSSLHNLAVFARDAHYV